MADGLEMDAGVKPASSSRRRGKKPPKNIFLEFNMSSTDQAMTEVEIGGVVVKRFNFKKYWQSDKDLKRWQAGLKDRTRFGGLLKKELMRYNPDFHLDQAILQTDHNSLRRQRDRTDEVDLKSTSAQEMRELRLKLQPQTKEEKKVAKKMDFSDLLRKPDGSGGLDLGLTLSIGTFATSLTEEPPNVDEDEATEALGHLLDFLAVRYGSLELAFHHIDDNKSGDVSLEEFAAACTAMGYSEDLTCLMTVLDKDRSGNLTMDEFLRLKPYLDNRLQASPPSSRRESKGPSLEQMMSEGSLGRQSWGSSRASAPPRVRRKALPPPVIKTGGTLLIFRNAIHGHSGDAVFLRQWPPTSLQSVMTEAEKVCKMLIGPATRLYDANLQVIKSVEQLELGGAYLMKGQEALDPPPRFMHRRHTGETSLRSLTRVGNAAAVEVEDNRRPPRELSITEPPQGSPPWHSRSMPLPAQGAKWQVDASVGMLLLNGGLGQRHQFHHFDTWERALPARRSIDRRTMSTTF